MVTHPAPPQTRTCAMHAYGSSSRAAAAPGAVHWAAVVRVGERNVSPLSPASGCSARRRLPSRGSLGPPFPTFVGTRRRSDCPLSLSGRFACRSLPDTWRAFRVRGLPHGRGTSGNAPRIPPGRVVTRSPLRVSRQGDRWLSHVPAFPRCRHAPLSDPGGVLRTRPHARRTAAFPCVQTVGSPRLSPLRGSLTRPACSLHPASYGPLRGGTRVRSCPAGEA